MKNVKAGDIIVHTDGDEAKVLEVLTSSFLISEWDNFETVGEWLTFEQAEANGWKIKEVKKYTVTPDNVEDWVKTMKGEGPFIFVDGERYRLVKE